jgi:hypothetical protein
MVEIDQPQPLETKVNYRSEPITRQIIFNWASQLPSSPLGIIDLAAGFGREVKQLKSKDFTCIGQDTSQFMVNHAICEIQKGDAEKLDHFPPDSFSGALLKDTLYVLSSLQKSQMLLNLQNVLVNQGSLLILSEINPEYIILYNPILYKPSGIHLFRDGSFKCSTIEKFITRYQQLKQENSYIRQLTYKNTPFSTQRIARRHGFDFELIQQFSEEDALAKENRWTDEAGFIAKLTKLS